MLNFKDRLSMFKAGLAETSPDIVLAELRSYEAKGIFVGDILVEHEMLLDKIDRLYEGLSEYYNYTDNIEGILCTLGLEDIVFEYMPPDSGEFTHKDCRFLLDEIRRYREK